MSHLAVARTIHAPVQLEKPFSNFDYIEKHFDGSHPIHKLFSVSRCHGGRTLLVEEVPPTGHVAEENEDLAALDSGFKHLKLVRISFWKIAFPGKKPPTKLRDRDCIGYALLKKDRLTRKDTDDKLYLKDEWHVYEAVLRSYPHSHSFAKARARFEFMAAGRKFHVSGCLYAEQNGVSKTCAQVAIRTVATAYLGHNRISYRTINALAAKGCRSFNPADGFYPSHTTKALHGLGIAHHLVDYSGLARKRRKSTDAFPEWERYPCEKLLYASIESGCGALMSFKPTDPDVPKDALHMIPFFGHTFNEDSWVPNAQKSYFRIGRKISYIPSLAWLSHFLAHDDNFGANFCVPRNFINPHHVRFVYELRPQGWVYSAVDAETTAAFIFCSILEGFPKKLENPWIRRLRKYSADKDRVILRHVPITTGAYLKKLRACRDWEDEQESDEVIEALKAALPARRKLWMIEISVPEVFPTNKRKLGEILLDASHPLDLEKDSNFVFGRLPGNFIFMKSAAQSEVPEFTFVRSRILSHTSLF